VRGSALALLLIIAQVAHPAAATDIYAVRHDGQLMFFQHSGDQDGTPVWNVRAQLVGPGWGVPHVFAGGAGSVYAVLDNGDLMYFNKANNWRAQKIGNGWLEKRLFAGDGGIIYVVNSVPELRRYWHAGFRDGQAKWDATVRIGSGWLFDKIFAGDDGAVYHVDSSGDLIFSRDNGPPGWKIHHRKVGSGWGPQQGVRHVFAGPSGAIYVVKDDGELLFFKHLGYRDGSATWAPGGPKRIDVGWDFRFVTAGRQAAVPFAAPQVKHHLKVVHVKPQGTPNVPKPIPRPTMQGVSDDACPPHCD